MPRLSNPAGPSARQIPLFLPSFLRRPTHPPGRVGVRQPAVLQAVEVVLVRVPAADAGRIIDANEAHAGLDEAAGQQARLAVGGAAVAVADAVRLAVDVEGLLRRARREQAQGP